MGLSTYTELEASIADWLNRADLTAQIPDFITLAEANINRDVRHPRMIVRSTATLTGQYLDVPTDYLEGLNFQVNDAQPYRLLYVSPAQADNIRFARWWGTTGRTQYYTIIGRQFEVVPTPDQTDLEVELAYYAAVPPLGAVTDDPDPGDIRETNWMLTLNPDAYLFGALAATAPYLKNDARLMVWAGLYTSAIKGIHLAGEKGRHPAGALNAKRRSYG